LWGYIIRSRTQQWNWFNLGKHSTLQTRHFALG
jgi:hypothetical protein